MKKFLIATAALVLAASASAATVMTDAQMDSVTAGWKKKNQSFAIALGGSAASASGGSTNVAGAAHLNFAKTTPTSAYAASAGVAVAYSSGKGGCGCGH